MRTRHCKARGQSISKDASAIETGVVAFFAEGVNPVVDLRPPFGPYDGIPSPSVISQFQCDA